MTNTMFKLPRVKRGINVLLFADNAVLVAELWGEAENADVRVVIGCDYKLLRVNSTKKN